MDWTSIITSVITALVTSGVIATVLTNYLEKTRDREKRRIEQREQQYGDFLKNTLAYFEGWENKEGKKELLKSLFSYAPLYASDKTIQLTNRFIKSFQKDSLDQIERDNIRAELVLEIRREMKKMNGDKTELTAKDFEIFKLD